MDVPPIAAELGVKPPTYSYAKLAIRPSCHCHRTADLFPTRAVLANGQALAVAGENTWSTLVTHILVCRHRFVRRGVRRIDLAWRARRHTSILGETSGFTRSLRWYVISVHRSIHAWVDIRWQWAELSSIAVQPRVVAAANPTQFGCIIYNWPSQLNSSALDIDRLSAYN